MSKLRRCEEITRPFGWRPGIRGRSRITKTALVILARPLRFTKQADDDLTRLEQDNGLAKRLKAVRKALGYLEINPRHQGLNTHEYDSLMGANGEKVFEAYAEHKTLAAYRVFWHYGPSKDVITIIAITPPP